MQPVPSMVVEEFAADGEEKMLVSCDLMLLYLASRTWSSEMRHELANDLRAAMRQQQEQVRVMARVPFQPRENSDGKVTRPQIDDSEEGKRVPKTRSGHCC